MVNINAAKMAMKRRRLQPARRPSGPKNISRVFERGSVGVGAADARAVMSNVSGSSMWVFKAAPVGQFFLCEHDGLAFMWRWSEREDLTCSPRLFAGG